MYFFSFMKVLLKQKKTPTTSGLLQNAMTGNSFEGNLPL